MGGEDLTVADPVDVDRLAKTTAPEAQLAVVGGDEHEPLEIASTVLPAALTLDLGRRDLGAELLIADLELGAGVEDLSADVLLAAPTVTGGREVCEPEQRQSERERGRAASDEGARSLT